MGRTYLPLIVQTTSMMLIVAILSVRSILEYILYENYTEQVVWCLV